MNTSELNRSPSFEHMQYHAPVNTTQRQFNGLAMAGSQQATQLIQSGVIEAINSKCNLIESQMSRGVPPATRLDLGKFLVDNKLSNPGGLTKWQENVCAWVLLEHTALNPSKKLSFRQLNSFSTQPDQLQIASKIALELSLTREHFTN